MSLEELFAQYLSDEERGEVEARAAEMLTDVRLAELRRALAVTQQEIAGALDRNQSAVAALEKRTDMLLSTLRRYVEALGGELEVIVRMPKRPPVRISLER